MRRRATLPAAFAVLVLVVGQLAALAHAAGTRHIECEEHGEQLEAAQLVAQLHHCEHDHWVGVESDLGSEHDDCAIARTLRQHSIAEDAAAPLHVTVASAQLAALVVVERVAIATLYRIAPKTSPPA